MRKLVIIILAVVLVYCSCAKKSDSSVKNNPTKTLIENATVFRHDAYGFYIELYPEYKQTDAASRTIDVLHGRKEELIIFNSSAKAHIVFKEFDEADKKNQGFSKKLNIPRNSEMENILNKSHPSMKEWEIYSYIREEGDGYLDRSIFFPPHRSDLSITVGFAYPKKDINIMKKKVKEMLSTIRIIDENSDIERETSKSIQIGIPPKKYK